MMRYPFAALIIACIFLDAAGAQEMTLLNLTPVVLSEQRTQVLRTYNLNPDCTAADAIVAKVAKQGRGKLSSKKI